MATTHETLTRLLEAQGRSPREGQIMAAEVIDHGDRHVALQAPTGVGKSSLAVAAVAAAGSGVIAMHSNGLINQYAAEIPEWEEALGVSIATLVGRAHYWCPMASDLSGLDDAVAVKVRATGTFLGTGLVQKDYEDHSVLRLAPEEDENGSSKSPCTNCHVRKAGTCPLWKARDAAVNAEIVVTNATMLGVALLGSAEWAASILGRVIVLDEAHADVDPLKKVLGHQYTMYDERAFEGVYEALHVLNEIASGKHLHYTRRESIARAGHFRAALDHFGMDRLMYEVVEDEGKRKEKKVRLVISADLKEEFKGRRVIAMSATLAQPTVNELGLDCSVVDLPGLDVSASRVFMHEDDPGWVWPGKDPDQHRVWAQSIADRLTKAFRSGGATLGLFVSRDDLHAVVKLLPHDVQDRTLHYYSGADLKKVIETYTADPRNHMIVGCVSGAGTGLNLPGDLLRTVIVSRVPQNCPRGIDRSRWLEDTRSAVVQAVGRAHRFDGDWGHVHVVGGFGHRRDVRESLLKLGWVLDRVTAF